MPLKKYPLQHNLVDGENLPVRLDHAYAVSGMQLHEAVTEIIDRHGANACLLPLSGMSGGAGVFQVEPPDSAPVIGLHMNACVQPNLTSAQAIDIRELGLDDVVVDQAQNLIYAGSAVNLNQLNLALTEQLGDGFRVLGADLTSYTYAQVGATFMTGGMGPQRRYFSDSVEQVCLHDGRQLQIIEGEALKDYAGTYGWSGLVTAVACRYISLPLQEVAFAIPVNNRPDDLAHLLQHFAPFAFLDTVDGDLQTTAGGRNLILGLEHITLDSMQPFLRDNDNALVRRAQQLQQNCLAAKADGLIFVNGFSDLPVDEFLLELVDNPQADEFTIAGTQLEHTEIFNNPEQMRAVREGIPYAARMQAPDGQFVYKNHTDSNIGLNPQQVESAMRQLWQINLGYVEAVQSYFDSQPAIRGEILVYGHLNPVGVDPHNRITLASDDKDAYRRAIDAVEALRDGFVRQLAQLCMDTDSVFVGGEKSAGSEYEMIPAFDRGNMPTNLAEKFERNKRAIHSAASLFNWRALKPYINPRKLETDID